MSKVEGERQAWDRLSGEGALWYERFWTYVELGPVKRSIEACYRARQTAEPGLTAGRAPSGWSTQARKWKWEERAARHDEAYRQRLSEKDADRRFWAREQRLEYIEEMLRLVMAGIRAAKLDVSEDDDANDGLKTERARRLLGVFRSFSHDLLVAHRLELGEPTSIEQRRQVELTADDLAEAQAMLEEWQAGLVSFHPERPGDAADGKTWRPGDGSTE